jgi:ABC-type transport system substrate-binding protein
VILVALVLTVGCNGNIEHPAGSIASPKNTVSSSSKPATSTVVMGDIVATEVPSATVDRTFSLAQSDVMFPAMVPSQLPVGSGGFIHRWGVYETAMIWSVDKPELETRLITDWEMDSDGLGWILELKRGVQFHGGWGEMTAEDFVWSFEDEIRETSVHSGIGLARSTGASIEAIDTYTVSIRLKQPSSFFFEAFLSNGSGAATKIFSKARVDALGVDGAFLDISGGEMESWRRGSTAGI